MSEFAGSGHDNHPPQEHHERHEPIGAPEILTLSANEFSALEERIQRAVEVIRRERQARAAAEERAVHAEEQLREHSPLMDQMEKDLNTLRTERDQVRGRVERLLAQLDALEL